MRIGIVSPFQPHDLRDLLDPPSQALLGSIRGVLATPVTPLARVWHRQGHILSVFCLDPSVAEEKFLRGERITIHVIPKRRARYFIFDFYRVECRLLREAILRERPDVLSAQWTYEHSWAALQTGIPTAVTCHDTPLRYVWLAKDWFTVYHLAMAWRVIRKAHRLICVSPYTAEHIKKYFFPRCPVDVVPNGLLENVFERGARRFANAPGEAGRAFTFCSAGGWGPIKNISTLLKAFKRVRENEPNARLFLFGRQLGAGEAAERWALRNRLHEGVSFAGGVSREFFLDFLETKADVMVHPSLVETFGMTFVEAMACGVPAIGGVNSGAVSWTLEEGQSGYLCDVRDEVALAQTMSRAMREPDQNRRLIRRAWEFAKARFSLEHVAASNEQILKQLWE